jgi:hypothetical protein
MHACQQWREGVEIEGIVLCAFYGRGSSDELTFLCRYAIHFVALPLTRSCRSRGASCMSQVLSRRERYIILRLVHTSTGGLASHKSDNTRTLDRARSVDQCARSRIRTLHTRSMADAPCTSGRRDGPCCWELLPPPSTCHARCNERGSYTVHVDFNLSKAQNLLHLLHSSYLISPSVLQQPALAHRLSWLPFFCTHSSSPTLLGRS